MVTPKTSAAKTSKFGAGGDTSVPALPSEKLASASPDSTLAALGSEFQNESDLRELAALTPEGEFLRDVKARAERVLTGTQTGQYTKRAMAYDIIRLVGYCYGRPA